MQQGLLQFLCNGESGRPQPLGATGWQGNARSAMQAGYSHYRIQSCDSHSAACHHMFVVQPLQHLMRVALAAHA